LELKHKDNCVSLLVGANDDEWLKVTKLNIHI